MVASSLNTVDDINHKSYITLRTLNCGNYGISLLLRVMQDLYQPYDRKAHFKIHMTLFGMTVVVVRTHAATVVRYRLLRCGD